MITITDFKLYSSCLLEVISKEIDADIITEKLIPLFHDKVFLVCLLEEQLLKWLLVQLAKYKSCIALRPYLLFIKWSFFPSSVCVSTLERWFIESQNYRGLRLTSKLLKKIKQKNEIRQQSKRNDYF